MPYYSPKFIGLSLKKTFVLVKNCIYLIVSILIYT